MTFEQIVEEEVKGRAEYESRQAEVWDDTVQQVEDMLRKKYPSTRTERRSGKKKTAAKISDRDFSYMMSSRKRAL